MPQSFRSVEKWADYTLCCPEREKTAWLGQQTWGKGNVGNLILYFFEVGMNNKILPAGVLG